MISTYTSPYAKLSEDSRILACFDDESGTDEGERISAVVRFTNLHSLSSLSQPFLERMCIAFSCTFRPSKYKTVMSIYTHIGKQMHVEDRLPITEDACAKFFMTRTFFETSLDELQHVFTVLNTKRLVIDESSETQLSIHVERELRERGLIIDHPHPTLPVSIVDLRDFVRTHEFTRSNHERLTMLASAIGCVVQANEPCAGLRKMICSVAWNNASDVMLITENDRAVLKTLQTTNYFNMSRDELDAACRTVGMEVRFSAASLSELLVKHFRRKGIYLPATRFVIGVNDGGAISTVPVPETIVATSCPELTAKVMKARSRQEANEYLEDERWVLMRRIDDVTAEIRRSCMLATEARVVSELDDDGDEVWNEETERQLEAKCILVDHFMNKVDSAKAEYTKLRARLEDVKSLRKTVSAKRMRPSSSSSSNAAAAAAVSTGIPSVFTCPVCWADDNKSPLVVMVPCNHIVCGACMERLVSCPLCRATITHTLKLTGTGA